MRLALPRLLKRPSAVSFLKNPKSQTLSIEQLDHSVKCLRCQVRGIQLRASLCKDPLSKIRLELPVLHNESVTRCPKFHVYDLGKQNSVFPGEAKLHASYPIEKRKTQWAIDPETLEYESDVGHFYDIGSRLVDTELHRHDFELWEELLRYRQRHYGEKGTLDIWEGLTQRALGVDLPVAGARADLFWESFIEAGLKREWLLNEVTNYAWQLWKRTGKRWHRFHETVVCGFLDRGLPSEAVRWHSKLQKPHLSHPNDIARVLGAALSCVAQPTMNLFLSERNLFSSRPGLQAFKAICCATKGHKIYRIAISTLMERGRPLDALFMHEFLVNRQDTPSDFEDVRPLWEYVESCMPRDNGKDKNDVMESRRQLQMFCKTAFKRQIDLETNPTDSQPPNMPTGETKEAAEGGWIREKQFKDEFGARLFATKPLTFDMILSGLQMFGVPAIGPLSLKEMALRSNGPKDILSKIERLRKAGIMIGDSVFSRLVRRLASENRGILLQDLLHSDQHPEVMDDAGLQESLLLSYYTARDWRPYNMTLVILNEILGGHIELFDVHFRKHIAAEEWNNASGLVNNICQQGKALSSNSIDFMIKQLLAPRVKGTAHFRRSRRRNVDEIGFVIQILQQVANLDGTISPDFWVEVLKRLGMTNRWDELRKLCHWLSYQYSAANKYPISTLDSEKRGQAINMLAHKQSVLPRVFSRQMQMAIVAWGFKLRPQTCMTTEYRPFAVEGESLVPWVRGLVLLRELQERGIWIWNSLVRRACRQRLRVLFGRPRYSVRRWNKLLRRENTYSAQKVIGDLIKVWGPSLFDGQEERDLEGLVNLPSTKMSSRRTRRNVMWLAQFPNRVIKFPI
ncbi:hypothetical protein V8E54_007108 [Elaphomyces granulatus]